MTKTENLNPAEAAQAMIKGNCVADKHNCIRKFNDKGEHVFWASNFRLWREACTLGAAHAPYRIVPDPSEPAPKPVPRVIASMDELEGFSGRLQIRGKYTTAWTEYSVRNGEILSLEMAIFTQHALSNDSWTVAVVREDA